jgi:hypothetical protein
MQERSEDMSAKLFPLGLINQTSRQSTGAVIFFHGSGNKRLMHLLQLIILSVNYNLECELVYFYCGVKI